jgi:hypothetical protein
MELTISGGCAVSSSGAVDHLLDVGQLFLEDRRPVSGRSVLEEVTGASSGIEETVSCGCESNSSGAMDHLLDVGQLFLEDRRLVSPVFSPSARFVLEEATSASSEIEATVSCGSAMNSSGTVDHLLDVGQLFLEDRRPVSTPTSLSK